jgi:phosphoribosylglycinamide formyltransferase-1
MRNIAVLASGGGSNLQSIIDSTGKGILKGIAKVVLVVSNNSDSYALERAKNKNIKAVCLERKNFSGEESFNGAILKELQEEKTDIICLAGYLRIIGQEVVERYRSRILNIHPSLLPKFGGKGMYGHYVHEAVIRSGETKSGATVHLVDENYDTGKIIMQQEVKVLDCDVPDDVAKRVLAVEHKIYPEAIKILIENLDKI